METALALQSAPNKNEPAEWIWYGVFDARDQLVDCSPGRFHAETVARDLTTKTKKPHTSAPVVIKRHEQAP